MSPPTEKMQDIIEKMQPAANPQGPAGVASPRKQRKEKRCQ
jgi:hypothetical protein